METMDLRAIQRPLKERYRSDPESGIFTLHTSAAQTETPVSTTVHMGEGVYESQAHPGVGGPGSAPCSGDLLLGALAACAQITCQMVATAMRVPVERIEAHVDGDFDVRGTLGISHDVPVGFKEIRVRLAIDAPEAMPDQIAALREKTEQYCVIMQTLLSPPAVRCEWA